MGGEVGCGPEDEMNPRKFSLITNNTGEDLRSEMFPVL